MDKESSEIIKLKERIAKDPKSKLFVPLAEEYKKAGDVGRAVSVLTEGLINNPGYVTARSFLGRLLMETGDLAGAQKELEEVIKAIPDNLLAQKKLGDLYILLGKPDDALKRYKAALALNSGDKEVSGFISDLEAGKDISDRFPMPKSAARSAPAKGPSSPVPPVQKTPAPFVQTKPAVQAPVSGPRPAAAGTAMAQQQSRPVPAPASAPLSGPSPKPKPVQEPVPAKQPAQNRPAEPAPKPSAVPPVTPPKMPEALQTPQATGGTPKVADAAVHLEPLQHLADEAAALHEVRKPPAKVVAPPKVVPEEQPFGSFDLSEPAGDAITFGAEPQPMEWAPPPEPVQEPVSEVKSTEPQDDINTDTLAELYISQSFYEKAIEIYERMLSERPGTAALEQKLKKLRSLATAAEKTGIVAPPAPAAASPVRDSGRGEYQPPAFDVKNEPFEGEEIPAAVIPPQAAELTPLDEPEQAPAAAAAIRPATTTDEESLKAMQEVLEGAERQKSSSPPAEPGPARASQTATGRRKETIDRLEHWLKNVMKEKPE